MQLIKEKFDIASLYRNQSIAEQNSVDLAWALLMEGNFKDLRNVIYATEEERKRFRQLVVNSKFLKSLRSRNCSRLRPSSPHVSLPNVVFNNASCLGHGYC